MAYSIPSKTLTHEAVMAMQQGAIAKAKEIDQPQCIVIVDASGEVLGEIRMTGAKFLSRKSALAKAMTASSIRAPSESVPQEVRPFIGLATEGLATGLPGGFPIVLEGECVGGIGVGSGSGTQDIDVATAALQAIKAQI